MLIPEYYACNHIRLVEDFLIRAHVGFQVQIFFREAVLLHSSVEEIGRGSERDINLLSELCYAAASCSMSALQNRLGCKLSPL